MNSIGETSYGGHRVKVQLILRASKQAPLVIAAKRDETTLWNTPTLASEGLPTKGGGGGTPKDDLPRAVGGVVVNCTLLAVFSMTTRMGFKKASNVDCKQRFWDTFAMTVGCVCVWVSQARPMSNHHRLYP